MRLIVTAQNSLPQSPVDQRFGRCLWLLLLDTESNHWQAFPNPDVSQPGGAGVAAAQFVLDQQVDVVISGDFGPHAARAFSAAKVDMRLFTEDVHTVQEAVDRYHHQGLPSFQ